MPEQRRPLRPRMMKPAASGESTDRAGPPKKKSRVKLNRILGLLLDASKPKLPPGLEGREAPMEGHAEVLLNEDFTTIPPLMLQNPSADENQEATAKTRKDAISPQ